ncbi:hypothetical protein WMY93_002518 [Mugilogobius chulae]|uniref:Xin actin-binding repeat-containing protein 2 n=1 Tax=Mugilogobius chulae TaxID=88201 RepID=A0AAW0Q4P5_9GOBI
MAKRSIQERADGPGYAPAVGKCQFVPAKSRPKSKRDKYKSSPQSRRYKSKSSPSQGETSTSQVPSQGETSTSQVPSQGDTSPSQVPSQGETSTSPQSRRNKYKSSPQSRRNKYKSSPQSRRDEYKSPVKEKQVQVKSPVKEKQVQVQVPSQGETSTSTSPQSSRNKYKSIPQSRRNKYKSSPQSRRDEYKSPVKEKQVQVKSPVKEKQVQVKSTVKERQVQVSVLDQGLQVQVKSPVKERQVQVKSPVKERQVRVKSPVKERQVQVSVLDQGLQVQVKFPVKERQVQVKSPVKERQVQVKSPVKERQVQVKSKHPSLIQFQTRDTDLQVQVQSRVIFLNQGANTHSLGRLHTDNNNNSAKVTDSRFGAGGRRERVYLIPESSWRLSLLPVFGMSWLALPHSGVSLVFTAFLTPALNKYHYITDPVSDQLQGTQQDPRFSSPFTVTRICTCLPLTLHCLEIMRTAGSKSFAKAKKKKNCNQRNRIHSENSEVDPLTNCVAMYQAAVSKKADNTCGVMEESEVCSLPGGITSVRRQFETQEIASSHSVTQFQFQHRTVQEMSNSEVTVSSSRQVLPGSQLNHNHQTMVSYSGSYENHENETEEEFPRYTTKELRDHFEKTIEEAAPHKPVKITRDINRSKWAASQTQNKTVSEKHRKELFSDFSESETVQVQNQEFSYEEDGEELNPDEEGEWEEILPGDVQSMRWMFENKPLDTIKDEVPDEDDDNKRITQQEVILGKDVRRTAWMFETKPMDKSEYKNKVNKLDKGDVRAAAWLFETETMDNLNKRRKEDDLTKEIVFTEEDGDSTIYMIDNKYMQTLGHTETIDESHLLILRSVLEEINGEMKTITSTFDTQFKCVIMGQASEILEVKSVRKIETEMENSIASRWLFDTQPLDLTNTESSTFKLVCSLSMEDSNKGDWGRWLFEIKTLSSLTEWERSKLEKKEIIGADPMDTLKDDSNAKPQTIEDIIGGNVKSARNFFETSPQVARKNCPEVGKLKKQTLTEEEKGDVRHQKWRFESQPLEQIGEARKKVTRTVNVENDLTQEDGTSVRADVRKNCWVFETQPMDQLKDDSNSNVKSARHYFETAPTEEIKELAEVGKLKKSVPLEEEKGDVRHQKWRFESQPLEQIREEKKEVIRTIDMEEIDKVDVSNYKNIFECTEINQQIDESQRILIEGVQSGSVKSNKTLFETFHEVKTVRREEVVKGDVTTCKWMFETRPIDQFDESISTYQIIKGISKQEIESGDVKTAKWLFETQPLDAIKYFSNIEDEETVVSTKNIDVMKGDVKTCKWLFETKPMDILYEKEDQSDECEKTQALDTIHDETETIVKTRTVDQEEITGKDVRTACFLFETENVQNLTEEETNSFKRITEIDIASGDVSRMKYIFENQASDIMTSTSEEARQKLKRVQTEDIQKGNVINCRWLFENQSIDMIHDNEEEHISNRTGRFIFETCSLDKIHEASDTEEIRKQKIVCDKEEKGDVRNYTMMFETQPLYAIKDKEGHYHEVTTVTSEEVKSGDVVGTRWLFETKPLDAIKDTDEVYIIKSVTQQDVQKGDVTSAKWKFETQPLDRISEERKALLRTVDDIQGGNVRMNKHRFESDNSSQQSVKTVNVSEIQKGDVRTAKWRFETQSIDKIKSMSAENLIETVRKEDIAKGDVKQSVWLFEKNPLDHIKEVDENTETTIIHEEIPKADVRTTTWLFETTPFDDFNESKVEKTEIMGKSIKRTLAELHSQKMVRSKGILIEADEIGDVRMAKYQLMNQQTPEIQLVIDSQEMGNISSTVQQLFSQEKQSSVEKEEILRGDIQEAINNLFQEGSSAKHGILIQEDEKGDVQMTLYSLLNKQDSASVEKEDIVKGDIRSALQRLSNPDELDESVKIKVDDIEKEMSTFTQRALNLTSSDKAEKEQIIGGDIKGTKRILNQSHVHIERTVEDVIPGDVHNTVKVFMSEPNIIKGDLRAALNSLSESVNQTVVVEKEEVVKGNIPKALRCLERAQRRQKEVEKPDIVPGNIRGALRSLERSTTSRIEPAVDDLVPGDVKATLKSLERAKQVVKEVEKEEIVRGDIHLAMQSLQDASSEKKICQQEIDVQGDPPSSPRVQRRASFEEDMKGDVKMSIKCLYESQEEQSQMEKEEVLKGDVKGTIKSLMENAQRETPKVQYRRVRVKQSPPVKNLSTDAQRNVQKIKTANTTKTTKSMSVEHKTIQQNHGIKTLKTEFRNLNSTSKGMIKLDKTRVKTDVYILQSKPSEPDLPLPPPPPPVVDADLLPPPPPPAVESDLPPPPPPLPSEQDFLPPPPSQQELEVKGPIVHPVPKLESKVEISKKQQAVSGKTVQTSQSTTTKTIRTEIPPLSESPQPLKKVIIPVRFTPPPSPPPSMRGKTSKFSTPLMQAEEKYRRLREESTPPTTPTPPPCYTPTPPPCYTPTPPPFSQTHTSEHQEQIKTKEIAPIAVNKEIQQSEEQKIIQVKEPEKKKEVSDLQPSTKESPDVNRVHAELDDIETMEKHECELVSEKIASSGASQRISKISIGSSKTRRSKSNKSMDLRAPSPLLRMRPPSPTFITIESTRRAASPQRVTPSPTLLHRPLTPPTPPPRRSDTPTSRLTRITPSPTFDRAENLARLKDTTAKLSRGVTPPPILPSQITEMKSSEIVESAAYSNQKIKVDSQATTTKSELKNLTKESEEMLLKDVCSPHELRDTEDEEISELTFASVREKMEFFEEAQKAEFNKTYVRKEPISIPERLGPDMEEEECVEVKEKEQDELPQADLSSLVNKFESTNEKTFADKKEPIPLAVRLHSDADSNDKNKTEQEMPNFDIQAIKNVFELGEQSSLFKDEKKDQEESASRLTETTADTSKMETPQEKKPSSQQSSPIPLRKNKLEDEFGNKITGTLTTVTQHSESTQRVPFSYADAVKRKAARRTETYDDDATEKLLRNFHKTWTESETVFKSLGYTVSSETSQVLSEETDSNSEIKCGKLLMTNTTRRPTGLKIQQSPGERLSSAAARRADVLKPRRAGDPEQRRPAGAEARTGRVASEKTQIRSQYYLQHSLVCGFSQHCRPQEQQNLHETELNIQEIPSCPDSAATERRLTGLLLLWFSLMSYVPICHSFRRSVEEDQLYHQCATFNLGLCGSVPCTEWDTKILRTLA